MQHTPAASAITELILQTFRLNGQLLEAGNRLTAPLGLTSARWQVLGAIENEGRPLTVAQVGRRMGLSRQAVQRIVNELEVHGFVTFSDNPDHKRAKLVELTPSCMKTLRTLEEVQSRWAKELANGLSEAVLTQTTKLLIEIRMQCESIEQEMKQP
jgi:DNA-binding MarR family transcriptional regulator